MLLGLSGPPAEVNVLGRLGLPPRRVLFSFWRRRDFRVFVSLGDPCIKRKFIYFRPRLLLCGIRLVRHGV